MNRKLAFSMTLILVASVLGIAMQVKQVKAGGTVYIKADGRVDPPTAPIQRNGDLYTLTGGITSDADGIIVERSSIVIDGAAYAVQSNASETAGNGITIVGAVSNVTIKNVNIKGFEHGAHFSSVSSNQILGSNITSNDYGIFFSFASNNKVSGNNITNNNYGFWLFSSSGNTISDNMIKNNNYSFYIRGTALSHFMQSIDVSNLVDGKPAYYLVNQKDLVINSTTHPQIGFLALVNSSSVTLGGLNLTNRWEGLLLAYTNNSRIRDNNIKNNKYGLWLSSSSGNTFSRNNFTNNEVGINLERSSNYNTISGSNLASNIASGVSASFSSNYNTISGNNLTSNRIGVSLDFSSNYNNIARNNVTASTFDGIELESSNFNSISENYLEDNGISVELTSSFNNTVSGNNIKRDIYGISVYDSSSYNVISLNNLTGNDVGIGLDTSNYNRIFGNNVTNNQFGVELFESANNAFFHNNFDNTMQVDILVAGYANLWDDNYPSGGNFWSNYAGVDADGDGIGDTPYVIDANNTDRFPFMQPYIPPLPDTTPPTFSIISPENKTYNARGVPLTFTVNEPTSWIGYSLDGQVNLTIVGNVTISDLSNQVHTVRVYANDTVGNMGYSDTIYFTVQTTSPDTTPPIVTILSPENKTYATTDVSLIFTVNESVQWIAYSIDNTPNVTVTGNTTLTGLSNGSHKIIVYALDTAGNTGASEKRYFTVETPSPQPQPQPEPSPSFPTTWIIVAMAIIAAVGVALLVYFTKITKRPVKSNRSLAKTRLLTCRDKMDFRMGIIRMLRTKSKSCFLNWIC